MVSANCDGMLGFATITVTGVLTFTGSVTVFGQLTDFQPDGRILISDMVGVFASATMTFDPNSASQGSFDLVGTWQIGQGPAYPMSDHWHVIVGSDGTGRLTCGFPRRDCDGNFSFTREALSGSYFFDHVYGTAEHPSRWQYSGPISLTRVK